MNKVPPSFSYIHVKCPVPECPHWGEVLTNNHCKAKHNMTRQEVLDKYGPPNKVFTEAVTKERLK